MGKLLAMFAFFCLSIYNLPAQGNVNDAQIYVIAHRGGIVPGIPENTMPAFQKCVELGVDAIELDLRSTSDRKIIILHDASVDRTTDGSGPVNALSISEVKSLNAGEGYSVPTFQEVIRLIKGKDIKLLLDLKEQDTWYRQEIVNLIQKYEVSDQIIIGARSLEDVLYFKRRDEKLKILGFIPDVTAAHSFISNGADIIRFWPDWIEQNLDVISLCQQNKIPMWVTGGDMGEDEIRGLINQGISGFIHDAPEKLMQFMSREH
jgi:glycerophosphoryl diester phosphodiesterase